MADVRVEPDAVSQLGRLPHAVHARINRIFERLAGWPAISGVRALRGRLAGRYRVRTGDYRVQFYVEGDTVVVERIGHRDGFYEE